MYLVHRPQEDFYSRVNDDDEARQALFEEFWKDVQVNRRIRRKVKDLPGSARVDTHLPTQLATVLHDRCS